LSFLLDTNVVSEVTKSRPNPHALAWFRSVPSSDLFLSVITLGEIRKGIELKRRTDARAAMRFEEWLETLSLRYAARILDFDEAAADAWGRIVAAHPSVPVEDGQLAATALRHGLALATRNTRHVAPTGVPHLDPFEPARR
jgi:predicted nucleic acid-binding protein